MFNKTQFIESCKTRKKLSRWPGYSRVGCGLHLELIHGLAGSGIDKVITGVGRHVSISFSSFRDSSPDLIFCRIGGDMHSGVLNNLTKNKLPKAGPKMTACCNNGTHPVIFRFEHIGIPETDKEKKWLSKQNLRKTAVRSLRAACDSSRAYPWILYDSFETIGIMKKTFQDDFLQNC